MPTGTRTLVLVTLGMKILVLGFAAVAATILTAEPPASLRSLFGQGDASHYLAIASQGYGAPTPREYIVHPPLFPALVAAVAVAVRDVALSGLIVSAVGAVASVVLLDVLARRELGTSGAGAAWALLTFPAAHALHLPLSDSVFLAFVLGAFLSARDGRWARASLLGALATLTRAQGILLLPAIGLEALLVARRTGTIRRAWGWLALVPLAYTGYLAMNWLVTGDPFAFVGEYRAVWGKALDWPWVGMGHLLTFATDPENAWPLWWGEIVFVVVGLVATMAAAMRLPAPYTVWIGTTWLLSVSTSIIASLPRYTLAMFPLFLLLAPAMRSRRWRLALTVPGIAIQLFLAARFALGQWAY